MENTKWSVVHVSEDLTKLNTYICHFIPSYVAYLLSVLLSCHYYQLSWLLVFILKTRFPILIHSVCLVALSTSGVVFLPFL
jgi:hypothetical protein